MLARAGRNALPIFALTDASSETSGNGATPTLLAGKDTWIPVVAGCADDANKNATDLQSDGIVLTRKDIYCGWDLSTLPSGRTVLSATLFLSVKTAASVSGTLGLNHLLDAAEGWAEATLTCSGALALTSFQTVTGAQFASTGEKALLLNATATARIQARMGVGNYSIIVTRESGVGTNAVLESADAGTNNAAGPRLQISYT